MEYVRISETNPDGLPVGPAEARPSAYPASARKLYADLPVDASSIRVLTLQPLEPKDDQDDPPAPLAGQLHVVSMGTHPEFTALSYVWGKHSEPPETIECNGISVEITPNCKDALLALRRLPAGPVTVWVDAVCINQEDDAEKAIQLPLMEEIYAWSQNVYICLGPGTESSDRAIEWLRRASAMSICLMPVCFSQFFTTWQLVFGFMGYWLRFIGLYTPWHILARRNCQRIILRSYNNEDIGSLLSREYFDRMWTFQEVILAQHPHILCGTKSLDWDSFLRGMDYIRRAESRISEYTNVTVNLRSYAGYQVVAPRKIRKRQFDNEIEQLRVMKDHMPANFDRWYAALQLWMSIDRKTVWRRRLMRYKTLGKSSMNAHQGPLATTYPGWLRRESIFWIRFSYSTLGYLFIVAVYLGICALAHWNWRRGVGFATLILIFVTLIYFGGLHGGASAYSTHWNPRYVGPFISVFGNNNEDKSGDKDSTSEVFLQAIAHAIKFRKVKFPRDRAYALYGILRSQGVRLSKINYKHSDSTVYHNLYCDLLYWDRASLVLLVDAGITAMPGKPSWVPDWEKAASRSWLPSNIYTSQPRSDKTRKLLDQSRAIGGGEKVFIRIDGGTLEVLGVIAGRVKACFGPPSRLDKGSVETMLARTDTPEDASASQDDPFDTNDEEVGAPDVEEIFSNLCRIYSNSTEPATSLWAAKLRMFMPLRRDLADLCQWAHLARRDSPCTPAYYSIPQALFEVLQARRLVTRFRRMWDGAVLADGSNIEQLFDMVPEPVPAGFQRLYQSISAHVGAGTPRGEDEDEGGGSNSLSYEDIADMVLVDIGGDAEVVRFLEAALGELAGRRNFFTTGKGHIGSGPPEMAAGDLVAYIAGVPVPMVLRRTQYGDSYIVIGPSYVQGLMDGEEIDEEQMEILKLV